MQPIIIDERGTVRFKPNAIVRAIADNPRHYAHRDGGIDLNKIALGNFPQEDVDQFWQMLGYSVSGYNELSLVSPESIREANHAAEVIMPGSGGCRAHGCPIHGADS